MRRTFSIVALVAAATAMLAFSIDINARPNRYGHSDREERHMLPSVSTGPLSPAWSPDGRWIAFSMRGDIWKMPAEGGEAIAITAGPAYYFEPAWSPDGARIALSFSKDGNLDIGVVSANGGPVETIATHPRVDVQPAWAWDGKSLFFVSARGGAFRIYRHDFTTNADAQVTNGIQPAVSPDGKLLAYEQGGLRVLDLATNESKLVRDEETEYRMEPSWTPDGQNIVYVTEDEGSNDLRIVAAAGGDAIELTTDTARHEMSPAVSPDGTKVAFVQFDGGVPSLFVAPIAGGRTSAWRRIDVAKRRTLSPTGRVRIRVTGADGQPVGARTYVDASDGRHYSPDNAFQRSMMVFDRHYFHMTAEAEVEVPAGRTSIEAIRGWQFVPKAVAVDVPAGGVTTVTIRLDRLIDLPARGWYSGDSHVHDLHQGFGQTHESFFRQLVAEDLNVTHALIHMDGTRLMGRWSDLTGKPSPLSTSAHILQYAQEFRGGLGHIGMIGTREFILPFVAGAGGTSYSQPSLENIYLEGARAQGGLAGFMHPYQQAPRTPQAAAATLIAVDLALGLGDYYDIGALWSDELASADFYYRLLNAGFKLPATGGTDNFSDVFLDPPPGSDRTLAHLAGPLTHQNWMDAIKRGHTTFSTGPILMLQVDGREPGDEITVGASAPTSMRVKADLVSIAPVDTLEILVNGEIVHTVRATDPLKLSFDAPVEVPQGGWVAARATGPKSKYLGDDYAFAQTTPVYVIRGGRRFVKATDAQFLADTCEAVWTRVQNSRWRSDAERTEFRAAIDKAKSYYLKLAGGGRF
ncbi:MAG TPA: CehA/McbA family metallohydrolase [Vicinamibacterales bacterium]|nr:CehA/McbA family metallohydrolase [Vicinamibacterales bacterium]